MSSNSDSLDSTIDALLNMGDMKEVQAILRDTPTLLSPEGLAHIRSRAAAESAAGHRQFAAMLMALGDTLAEVQSRIGSCASPAIVEAVDELLRVDTWDESRKLFDQRPELLSDSADARLSQLIESARGEGSDVHLIEEARSLVRRARVVGVREALAEKARMSEVVYDFLQAENWAESRSILEEHPDLLSDEVEHMLKHMVADAQAGGERDAVAFLAENLTLIRRARQTNIATAFEEVMAGPAAALMVPMDEFLDTDTWDQTREVLVRHPELMSEEGDLLLARLIQAAQDARDEDGVEYFRGRRRLLQLCRRNGVDACFDDLEGDEDND